MPSASRETGTAPRQLRSAETRRRLLDAAEALIEEKGLADASIPEIVRRAGSSVGGFYARFQDKNALLRALEERFFDEMRGRVDLLSDPDRWAEAGIPVIARACVQELVSIFREREALIRALELRAAHDPSFIQDGLRFRRRVSERLCALLTTRKAEIRHPEPELAVDLCVQLAFALMHQLVLFGEIRAGSRVLSDGELVEELTRNVLAYLGAEETP